MATSRDLEFRILTTLEAGGLEQAAAQLDDLGKAGLDASHDLEQAGNAVDDLGDKAKRSADTAGTALDDLGRSSRDAGDDLKNLGKAGKSTGDDLDKAGKNLDDLGDQAKATAKTVDDSFDSMGRSSKASMDKVDDGAHKAKEGLGEFKDEAAGTSREAAASFSGVESALDAVQETAANAFAGFGPAGAIAGVAAAAGIGLVFSALQTAADNANAAKDRVIELAQAIRDAGGRLSDVDIPGMMQDWAFAIADNKSWWELWQKDNTTNLEKFRDKADEAGISVKDMFDAMSGTDPQALARTLEDLNTKIAETSQMEEGAARASRRALLDTKDAILEKAGETEAAIKLDADAAEALGRTTAAQQEAADATREAADAIDAYTEPAGVYLALLADKQTKEQESAQATADATKSQSDSWQDYIGDVTVSVDEYLDALEKQVKAQEDWAGNLATLAKRGVEQGVLAQLERMGPEGAPLVAELTTASDKELKRLVALYGRQGKAAATKTAEGISSGKGEVTGAARSVHNAASDIFGQRIDIPVGVDAPSPRQLATIRQGIQQGIGTVTVVPKVVLPGDLFRQVP